MDGPLPQPEPGSPEAIAAVEQHQEGLRVAAEFRRLRDEYEEAQSPAGRTATASEEILRVLLRIEKLLEAR